jgi:hypothetical protein
MSTDFGADTLGFATSEAAKVDAWAEGTGLSPLLLRVCNSETMVYRPF